jgi:hypothetical protein
MYYPPQDEKVFGGIHQRFERNVNVHKMRK